eukprot:scaffold1943_cov21-Tisochrysis_lutea.AAC.1
METMGFLFILCHDCADCADCAILVEGLVEEGAASVCRCCCLLMLLPARSAACRCCCMRNLLLPVGATLYKSAFSLCQSGRNFFQPVISWPGH